MILDCGCPANFPDWHQQDIDLAGHCVHRLTTPNFFYMPMAFEAYTKRQHEAVTGLGLIERWPGLILARSGLFRGELLRLLEDAESLSRHVAYLPSPFKLRAELHQGDIHSIRKAIGQMQMRLLDTGKKPAELYLCHLTCPQCSEERGGDKILLLRRFSESQALKKKLKQQQKRAPTNPA